MKVSAQNTCSSSTDITDTLILVNDSSVVSWFKFSSNTSNKVIDVNNWNSSLDSIIIYSGSCSQLNKIISYTIDSGYNRYFIPNTTIGITYYLSVYKNQTDTFSIQSFDAFNKSTCETSTCNLINNGGFEQGLIAPTLYTFQLINNSYESIVPCWFSAKNKDICGSEFTNSYYAQILDKSYTTNFSTCSNPSTLTLGIPLNYVSDGVLNTYDFYDPTNLNSNNRYVSMHVLSEIVGSLNNPVYQGKYILEYDFGITHCYNVAPYRLCVNFSLVDPNFAYPNIKSIWATSVNNNNAPLLNFEAGDWMHQTHCIDIPNASFGNYTIVDATNIGFRYYVNDASANEQGGYVFDNFRLTRLAPEVDDYTICSGEKLNLTVPCPVNGVTYSWVPVGTPLCSGCLSCTNCTNTVFSYVNNTNSPVTFTYKLVAVFQGCAAQEFFTITVQPSYLETTLVNADIPLKSCDPDAQFLVINPVSGINYLIYIDYVNPLLTDITQNGTVINFSSLLPGEEAHIWISSFNPDNDCYAESEVLTILGCCLAVSSLNEIDVPYSFTTLSQFTDWAVSNNYMLVNNSVNIPGGITYAAYQPTSSYLDHIFIFNNNLIVDDTRRFTQCHFKFGEQVRWEIPNSPAYYNIELRFYRTTLDAACKEIMWAGIFSLNPFSGVYLDGSVNVFHAKTGIKSENGGQVHVSVENVFDNNNIGIMVINATNVNYDFMTVSGGNSFSNSEGYLYNPYNLLENDGTPKRGRCGILITNVKPLSNGIVTIGDNTNTNTFSDTNFGILSSNSNVQLTSLNKFSNHKRYVSALIPYTGAAVSVNNITSADNSYFYFDGANSELITNCDNGIILSNGKIYATLSRISMNKVITGVSVSNLTLVSFISIVNNTISDCRFGITSRKNLRGVFRISENSIYNGNDGMLLGINKRGICISVDEVSGLNLNYYGIQCNYLYPSVNGRGIYFSGANNNCNIISNKIQFNYNNTSLANSYLYRQFGILYNNNYRLNIVKNNITAISNTTGMFHKRTGINGNLNQLIELRCNNLDYCGTGLFLNSSNLDTRITGNATNHHNTAMLFRLTHPQDLGSIDKSGGNTWQNGQITSGINNLSGDAVTVYTQIADYPFFPNGLTQGNVLYDADLNRPSDEACPTYSCSQPIAFAMDSNSANPDYFEHQIVNDSIVPTEYISSSEVLDLKRMLFRKMRENPESYTANTEFIQFRENMSEQALGKMILYLDSLNHIFSSMDSTSFPIDMDNIIFSFKYKFDVLNDNNVSVINDRIVYSLYLQHLLNTDVLSDSIFTILNNIAKQCPLIGGSAVYNARAIINSYYPTIEFDSDSICQIAGYRNENITEETVKSFLNSDFTIYPIPTYDNLIIENVMQCQYEIFDIVGVLRMQGNFTSNRSTVNISELADGFYILKLLKTDGTESCIKVIKA